MGAIYEKLLRPLLFRIDSGAACEMAVGFPGPSGPDFACLQAARGALGAGGNAVQACGGLRLALSERGRPRGRIRQERARMASGGRSRVWSRRDRHRDRSFPGRKPQAQDVPLPRPGGRHQPARLQQQGCRGCRPGPCGAPPSRKAPDSPRHQSRKIEGGQHRRGRSRTISPAFREGSRTTPTTSCSTSRVPTPRPAPQLQNESRLEGAAAGRHSRANLGAGCRAKGPRPDSPQR